MGRVLAGLLAAVFAFFGVFLVWAWTGQNAAANEAVSYVKYTWDDVEMELDSTEESVSNYETVNNSTTTWGSNGAAGSECSWYVATGTVEISSRVTVSGDVCLILKNDSSLTVNGGIGVPESASFTVYGQAQSEGTKPGELKAETGTQYHAGIGGTNYQKGAGSITIHGGEVTASGGAGGAGIGGSTYSSVESIAIYGGTVNAKGGQGTTGFVRGGAGIGSGQQGSVESIVINGGTVTANGGTYAAGIGSGYYNSSAKSITINGGTVNAYGGQYGAGLGSGYGDYEHSSAGTITINGGQVTAEGDYGAGIGGGYCGSVDSIAISGGQVKAKGIDYAAGIGSGRQGSVESITVSGGQVEATGGDWGSGIGSSFAASVDSIMVSGGTVEVTGGDYGAGIGGNYKYASVKSIAVSGGIITATGGNDAGTSVFYTAGEAIGIGISDDSSVGSMELVISGGYFKLTAGADSDGETTVAALNAGATVSGGVFDVGDSYSASAVGGVVSVSDPGKVYGVVPVDGYYVVQNMDSNSRDDYPYVVLQVGSFAEGTISGLDELEGKTYDGTPLDFSAASVSGAYGTGSQITGGSESLRVACYVQTGTGSDGNPVWGKDSVNCSGLVDAGSYRVTALLAGGVLVADGNLVDMALDPVTGAFTGDSVGLAEVAAYVATSAEAVVNIAARPVTAMVTGDTFKTYDGTTTVGTGTEGAFSSLEVGLTNVVEADKDNVQLDSVSYEYDSPDAGTKAVNVTIGKLSGGKAGNYKLTDSTVTYDVESGIGQAVPIVSGLADGVQVESGTSLADLTESVTVTGVGGNTLPGVWSWTDQNGDPVTEVTGIPGSQVTLTWTFTPEDATNYSAVSGETMFTVIETPLLEVSVSFPEFGAVKSGTSLDVIAGQATVTDPDGEAVTGTWLWTGQNGNPVTEVTGNPGDEVTLVWTFTPDDLAYETVTGEVTFTITGSITPGAGGDEPGTGSGNDPAIDTGDEDVTGDDAAVGTGSTGGGSSEGLAATGVDASLLALLGLAVLAGLSGLTMVTRKRS